MINMLPPLCFMDEETLVTILKVIEKLNIDLKEIIIQKIVTDLSNEEFKKEFPIDYILFSYEEIGDISDWYSE